jgi:RNA ligase (TIGR02306 family)
MRKLASIRIVKEINPIEGADNIEAITVDGWTCISKKGEFNPGDMCVYFEIDSFLPIRPEFEFLRKSSYKKMGEQEGFRLRTIRLRGTLSQGLALPLSIIPGKDEGDNKYVNDPVFDGHDVTEELGVILFEKPISPQLQGKATNWPSFIRKTDQERVQNIWNKIKDSDELFEVTLKMDGMSCTYYLHDGHFGVCSRNWEIVDTPGNTLWEIARRYGIKELLEYYHLHGGNSVALQGEVIGEGIQKNPHNIKGQDFYLFDIWNINTQSYLCPTYRKLAYIGSDNGNIKRLKRVPELNAAKSLKDFNGDINNILEYANGSDLREGVVFKSVTSDLTFKVISNNYLLAEK